VKLKPYPEYRDSDLPWLGEIPAHWETLRIKRLLSSMDYGTSANLGSVGSVRVLTMSHIRDGEIILPEVGSPDDIQPELFLERNDLLFNRTNSPELVGKIGIFRGTLDDRVSFASYLVRLRLKAENDPEYANYLLNCDAFLRFARSQALVSLHQANLNSSRYSRISVTVPPPEEQRKIADFLDGHGHLVRRLIRAKQRLIELLNEQKQAIIHRTVTRGLDPDAPTEPTGFDWLREVPEHWEIKPLKRWAKINGCVLSEMTDPDYIFQYLDIGAVGTGFLTEQPELMRFGDAPSRARRVLKQGDTIISTVRTYLKAVYFVADDQKNLIASTGFAVLTPNPNVVPEYLSFVIQSNTFVERVMANSVGIAYPAIAEPRLGALHLALPPTVSEQLLMVHYIKRETQTIDEAIRRAQREMELIREYRTRLISDVVTGKLDVRGAELPESDAGEEGVYTDPDGLESVVAEGSPGPEEVPDAHLRHE
jgi:type I restriction enzyme S subunit